MAAKADSAISLLFTKLATWIGYRISLCFLSFVSSIYYLKLSSRVDTDGKLAARNHQEFLQMMRGGMKVPAGNGSLA